MAQLAAHQYGVLGAAGSSPVTPTKKLPYEYLQDMLLTKMLGIYLFKLNSKNLKDVLKIKGLDFVWVASKNVKYLETMKNAGIKLFYPIGINGARTKYEKRFTAIDKSGNKVPTFAGWYTGVCPNNPVIRNRRLKEIKSFIDSRLSNYYEGIYLDAIRYPTYWEDKRVVYLDTCYCDICMKLYKNQNRSWTEFRETQIEELVKDIKKIMGKKVLGYFAVPESQRNLEKVFAQQPEVFYKYFDLVSPMIYPQMVGKGLKWVGAVLNFFGKYYRKDQIIPIIQTSKMPDNSPDKFDNEDAKRLTHYINKRANFGFFALDLVKTQEKQSKADVVNLYLK